MPDARLRLSFEEPLRLLAALADLHDLGYEGFETNFASLADSFADPQPARAEIARRGLPLIGLHMGAALFSPARLEKEQEQIAQVFGLTFNAPTDTFQYLVSGNGPYFGVETEDCCLEGDHWGVTIDSTDAGGTDTPGAAVAQCRVIEVIETLHEPVRLLLIGRVLLLGQEELLALVEVARRLGEAGRCTGPP